MGVLKEQGPLEAAVSSIGASNSAFAQPQKQPHSQRSPVRAWNTVGDKDPTSLSKTLRQPDMVAHARNPSIGETEAGGSWSVLGLLVENLCPMQIAFGWSPHSGWICDAAEAWEVGSGHAASGVPRAQAWP